MILIGDMRRYPRRMGYASRACEYSTLARGDEFVPPSLANLSAWYRADQGVTLGTTLLAAGTTPPAATISGTLNQSLGLYIQIDFPGTRGVATFKWSTNNGTSFVATGVLTAASVVLGATGITVAFPNAAYLTDNIYRATVASWADLSGGGHTLVQATPASQPLLIASARNGRPGLQFDGVDDAFTSAFARAEPRTVIATAQLTGASGGLYDAISINRGRHFKVNATSVSDGDGGGGLSFAGTEQNNWHANIDIFNGASSSFRLEDNNANNGNSGAPVPDGITLGGLAGPSTFVACVVTEFIDYARALSAAEIGTVIVYQKDQYLL